MLPVQSAGAPPHGHKAQVAVASPIQDQLADLTRLEHVLHQEIANANAQAKAKGSVVRRYPVARIKHIMKRSAPQNRRVVISQEAVLAMTNLTQVMTACMANVAWERTRQRYANSSSTPCVQLMDVVSATSSMPQFDVRESNGANRTPRIYLGPCVAVCDPCPPICAAVSYRCEWCGH